MNIYVIVFWDSAKIKIFENNKKALNYLINNKYKNIGKNSWANSPEDFDNGKYITLFNEKIE